MRKGFIFLLTLYISQNCYSQVITITDNETNEPLEHVTLSSKMPYTQTTTDIQGQANVEIFRRADSIEIRSMGYNTIIKSYIALDSVFFKLKLIPSLIRMDEIVVSATRWKQASNELFLKMTAISPAEVTLQNPQTTADLLSNSGKVYIQKSQQGGGSPIIRGFSANRLLYSVDGVRMNTAIFRGGNIQNVNSLDPFAIESTEVLFGAGSVIYGSDAIGGVMSFQTLKPQLSLSNKMLIKGKAINRYSSANNEKTGHFDINIGCRKWAFITSISTNDFGNLHMGSNGPDDYLNPLYINPEGNIDVIVPNKDPELQIPSAYSQFNLMQKVLFKPDQQWEYQFGFHYSETSKYGRYDRHLRLINGNPRYAEWDYGPQKWIMNNLAINHARKNSVYDKMIINLAQQSFEESRIERSLNQTNRTIRTENVEAYSLSIDFVKSTSVKTKLFYGAEYVLNDVKSKGVNKDITNGSYSSGPARYPQATWQSIAVYINSQQNLSNTLLFQAGLRYNQFLLTAEFDTTFYPLPFTDSNLNNGTLTGNLGVVYHPYTWIISANLNSAFRSPNVDDLGKVFDSEAGSITVPNPGLKAEYAYNGDLSIVKTLFDFLKIELTGYYTFLQKAMVRRKWTLNGLDSIMYDGSLNAVQAIQNAAFAKVWGIQAGMEITMPAGFTFSSDFNYQKGEEEHDDGTINPSRHAAPLFGTTRLTYMHGKLKLQVYTNFQGERTFEDMAYEEQNKEEIYASDNQGQPYAPQWYTINLKGIYILHENFTVSAGIENMADKRYRPYSSGIAAAGRNYILSMIINF